MLNYYFVQYGVPLIIFFKNTYDSLSNECSYYYNVLSKVLNSNELVFFENNPNAYVSGFINTNSENSALVLWRYNFQTKVFNSYNCIHKDTKHFPILSACLVSDSKKINLDDFFEELKVETSNNGFPTLQQVMEVYTYTYGVVLDKTKSWKLNILDSSVNEHTLDIEKDSWPFT